MNQIKRIQTILGSKHLTSCPDCGFKYLPMNEVTEFLCPKCQLDLIESLEDNEIEVEEVSMENELIEDYLSEVAFEFNVKKQKR